MRYSLRIKTPAEDYPVTLDEVSNQIRYDLTNPNHVREENYINGLIRAATKMLEDHCGRAFITQTFKLALIPSLETVPNVSGVSYGYEILPEVIKVWRPPCQKVNSINAVDYAGTLHLQPSTMYSVNTNAEPAEVQLIYGGWWEWYVRGYYIIDFDAGYGDTADSVPQVIRDAILQTVAQWYRDREQSNYTISPTAMAMVSDYAIGSWEL